MGSLKKEDKVKLKAVISWNGLVEFEAVSGDGVMLDTSDEMCSKFGFKPGDRVYIEETDEFGTIMGAGLDPERGDLAIRLWSRRDGASVVAYADSYIKVDKETEELLRKLELGPSEEHRLRKPGSYVKLYTSEEVCKAWFGFKPWDRVRVTFMDNQFATVRGVGKEEKESPGALLKSIMGGSMASGETKFGYRLWYSLDWDGGGIVSYSDASGLELVEEAQLWPG